MAFVCSLVETQPAAASGTRAKAMIAPNVLRICGLLGRRAWRSASDPLWQKNARWTKNYVPQRDADALSGPRAARRSAPAAGGRHGADRPGWPRTAAPACARTTPG